MRKLALGILAHVDAGKTTLSEAMLYQGGRLRKLGRVDHQDAFLDTDALERDRGITIFSKQAVLPLPDLELTLLDTPGHVDFSAEMERTLQVLDAAVLVISGTDGVQGHTRTLWRLLRRWRIPTFLFINKMDLAGTDRDALLSELRTRLDEGCVDAGLPEAELWEQAALCGEEALNHYLETGRLADSELGALVAGRQLFPCFFGSALKLQGVDALLDGLRRWAPIPAVKPEFAAKVYKISRDPQGARLTYLKITGGTLRVKDPLSGRDGEWKEKVDQIRIYSGARFQTAEEAPAGTVCAVTGLSRTWPGQGLGAEPDSDAPLLEPVLTSRVLLPEGCNVHTALATLRQLEEEDPQLHLVWNEQLQELHLQLMGQVQLEVLSRRILDRFGLQVSFGPGSIVYRETIAGPVEGVGHFEPLRHYAEVHLLLEPGPRGSGLRFSTRCSEDVLDRNWQRLILTHLAERTHRGVLTGAPITDLKITLTAGRAHEKHTEGGDFRQATYRAVRQGLMRAESVLLEPWYDFQLEIPAECVGRAMADLTRMQADSQPPQTHGDRVELTGSAPVSAMRDYATEVAAYTRGQGRLFCAPGGYAPCREQEAVVAAAGYDPLRDTEQPADSVFCSHGAGFVVPWDQVPAYMHLPATLPEKAPPEPEPVSPPPPPAPKAAVSSLEQDKELEAIYEMAYGKIRRRDPFAPVKSPSSAAGPEPFRPREGVGGLGPDYLLIDGYNIIFAWEELKAIARDSLDTARRSLIDLLVNYQGYQKNQVILVFDAYRVPGGTEHIEQDHGVFIVYTKEAETADAYIERTTYELSRRRHRVRVATSDGPEQLIILGHGALRMTPLTLRAEIEQVQGRISEILERSGRRRNSRPIQAALEKAKREKK